MHRKTQHGVPVKNCNEDGIECHLRQVGLSKKEDLRRKYTLKCVFFMKKTLKSIFFTMFYINARTNSILRNCILCKKSLKIKKLYT